MTCAKCVCARFFRSRQSMSRSFPKFERCYLQMFRWKLPKGFGQFEVSSANGLSVCSITKRCILLFLRAGARWSRSISSNFGNQSKEECLAEVIRYFLSILEFGRKRYAGRILTVKLCLNSCLGVWIWIWIFVWISSMFQSMTWAFQITIVDLTTRPGSKVMTFQRHHYQPDSGQPFQPFLAVNLTVSGFPVRIRFTPNSTVNSL